MTWFCLCMLFSVAVPADGAPPSGRVPRIVGGNDVNPPFSIPFIAAIIIEGEGSNSRRGQDCGASIIGSKHALTAAHCVTQESVKGGRKPLVLEAWRHDLTVPATQERPSHADIMARNAIVAVHRHPGQGHDVAVIELEREYPSTVYSMVVLNENKSLESDDGRSATVIGWGGTTETGAKPSAKLQTVDLDILNSNTCSQLYQAANYFPLKTWEFCAREHNKDSCFGDSGGPLYETYMSEGNMYYLITGIVSGGGERCAKFSEPGIYASVAHHLTFIQSKLASAPTPAPTPASCSSLKTNDRWAQKGLCPRRCGDGKCHKLCGQKCSTGCACNAPCVSLKPNDKWAQKGICPLKCGFMKDQAQCHVACGKKCSPLCPCNLPPRRLLANAIVADVFV